MKFFLVIFLFSANVLAKEAVHMKSCPNFEASYSKCEKIDGILPVFFESVEISRLENSFKLKTKTVQGPLTTHYTPDKIVRGAKDYHYTETGEVLPNLPSHESSYCEDGKLFGKEITFLPNGTVAHESLVFKVSPGKIYFTVHVGEKLLLDAICSR